MAGGQEGVIEKIKDLVMKRSGIYFREHQMQSLKENIALRLAATKSSRAAEYYNLLKGEAADAHKEFTELLNLLTIKHTHFFRYPAQFTALRERVLPQILGRKKGSKDLALKVFSAGCATGEEPYSIAMIVLGLLGNSGGWKVSILATDISTEALITAKKGIYPKRSLKNVDENFIKEYIERFCLIHQDKVFVGPAVKEMVEFQYLNLVDEVYPAGFDIIFCRKVTIYFEPEVIGKVMQKLYQSLNAGGYLFTGGTEPMRGISDKFELLEFEQALAYKKIPIREAKPAEKIAWPWQPPISNVELQMSLARAGAQNEISAPKPQADAQAHILLARILMNQDKLAQAELECQKAIKINFLFADAHYLLGLIYKKKAAYKEAAAFLKKAVYLERNYSLAHFTLAQIYRQEGKSDEAERAYRNTLKSLEQESQEHFREFCDGLTKKVLAQVCVRGMKEIRNIPCRRAGNAYGSRKGEQRAKGNRG